MPKKIACPAQEKIKSVII